MKFFFVLLVSLSVLGSATQAVENDDEGEEEDLEESAPELLVNCYRSEKLNLSGVFQKGESAKKVSQKIIFHKLLQILYGNQPLFSLGDNSKKVIDLFDEVEKRAEKISREKPFVKVSDLACISLRDDPAIQNLKHSVYYHILKGGCGEFINGHRCRLVSLGKYINLNNRSAEILNVYLASKPLLQALFQNEFIVNEVLSYRRALWCTLRDKKCIDKRKLEEEFRQKFIPSIPASIEVKYISFNIYMVARE